MRVDALFPENGRHQPGVQILTGGLEQIEKPAAMPGVSRQPAA